MHELSAEIRTGDRHGVTESSCDALLRCFADSLGADSAILVSHSPAEGTRALATFARDGREPVVSWTHASLIGRALQGSESLVEPEGEEGEVLPRAVAAPVRSHDGVVGALWAGFHPWSSLPATEVRWSAGSYAGVAALCMTGDLALPAALATAGVDPLTACLNAAGLAARLRAEVDRSRRLGHDLCCCCLGLDGFDRVNETRGRLEANRALAAAGVALRAAARGYDAIGRVDVDEFVVGLPETDAKGGRRVAERLRASVAEALAIETGFSINASAGVAQWDGKVTATGLVEAAESSMRAAQRLGGGQVIVAESPDRRLEGLRRLRRQVMGSGQAE